MEMFPALFFLLQRVLMVLLVFLFFAFRRAEEEVTRARAKRSRWDVHLNVTTLLFYFGSLMAPGWWGTVLCK